jgi:phosphoribosylanthranilate isomerase
MPVLVKICGNTNVEDAVAAAELGADFIGLNFYPGSPRCVTKDQARQIWDAVAGYPLEVIGVFVNESWSRIREVLDPPEICFAQTHGQNLEPCPWDDLSWLPAFSIRDQSSLPVVLDLLSRCKPELPPFAVLFDSHTAGMYGGTGQLAPWSLLADFHPQVLWKLEGMETTFDVSLILAGGLTPDNVAEAIRIVRPWAVDVASGVESSPGKKDHEKMRRFIENAKAADQS